MTDKIALASTIAYPGSGKTTVAKYLSRELGFNRVASDDMRLMQTDREFGDKGYTVDQENILWDIKMPTIRDIDLACGYNVVMETCGNNPHGRAALLGMPDSFVPLRDYVGQALEERDQELARYQIQLDVDEDLLIQRLMERDGRSEENAKGMLGLKRFGEVPIDGVETLIYENNTQEDLDFIKNDLKERLGECLPKPVDMEAR